MKQNRSRKPSVSVIMPVFNAEKFLPEAIESILNQSFRNFEFIIIDDASRDNSWKIIEGYRNKYPAIIRSVRLKVNRNNGGDACANEGFKLARGEFIARMDADDIAHPERLEKQIKYMDKHPGVILLGSQAYVINKDSRITGIKSEPTNHKKIRTDYCIYHPIIHPTVVIRKSLLPYSNRLYNIKYNANNDLLTFFELLNFGKFANLPEKLLFYRIHGKNDSLINPKGRFFNTIRIRIHAWKHFNYRPSIKALFMNLLQAVIMLTMPSSVVTYLYMSWRGLSKHQPDSLSLHLSPATVTS